MQQDSICSIEFLCNIISLLFPLNFSVLTNYYKIINPPEPEKVPETSQLRETNLEREQLGVDDGRVINYINSFFNFSIFLF